jgi:hypothetical protein
MTAAGLNAAPEPGKDEQARRLRSMRAVDRGLRSVQFDSKSWLAQWKAPGDANAQSDAFVRLLFAVPPQAPPARGEEPLAMLRGLVLDAAFELE